MTAMSSIELLGLETTDDPNGMPRFSAAAVAAPGARLFTATLLPQDSDGATVDPGDVQGQTQFCIRVLGALLDSEGGSLADVLSVTVYVAESMQVDLGVALSALAGEFGEHRPAVTGVGVQVLRGDEQVVELSVIAALTPQG